MDKKRMQQLISELRVNARIESVSMNEDDLVIRIGGESVRVAADREHNRTACWATIEQFAPGTGKAAAGTARLYNSGLRQKSGVTMGIFRWGSAVLLGRSIGKPDPGGEEIVALAASVQTSMADARALLAATVETLRGAEQQALAVSGDVHLVRL